MRLIGAVLVVAVIVHGFRNNEGYVEGGRYRLHYDAGSWQHARDRCRMGGGKLAVPKSEDEFKLIQGVVRKMRFRNIRGWSGIPLAWLGISNLDDYRTWRTVDGEDIRNTGFSTWTGESSWEHSENPNEPHCAGADPVNRGLRVHWCHLRQPYVCEYNLKQRTKVTDGRILYVTGRSRSQI